MFCPATAFNNSLLNESPPCSVSSPAPPLRISLPKPPKRLSIPPSPYNVSSPAFPSKVLFCASPFILSLSSGSGSYPPPPPLPYVGGVDEGKLKDGQSGSGPITTVDKPIVSSQKCFFVV